MNDRERRAKTGAIGEHILDEYIRQRGYVPYRPDADHAHPFDRLIASLDKQRICIVEVKTKPKRKAYDDTGINQSHFQDYQRITLTYNVPLFLAFVDCEEGAMYGNWWHELLKTRVSTRPVLMHHGRPFGGGESYPWTQRGIVYFQRAAMRLLYVLTEDERAELRALHCSRWVPETDALPFHEVNP
jgi:hypothetical protein